MDGESLAERIERGPIPVDVLLAIAKQVAEALKAVYMWTRSGEELFYLAPTVALMSVWAATIARQPQLGVGFAPATLSSNLEVAVTSSTVLTALVVTGVSSIVLSALEQPTPAPEAVQATKIEKVRDNLFVITGADPAGPGGRVAVSGGNTAVFVTATGVVLVDTKNPGWGRVILERVRSVTDKPITMIINTRTHADHTGSNSMFFPTVDIVAHENTKANMQGMDAFKGVNAAFLPKRTFREILTVGNGRDRIELRYFGRGHTNGDAW